LSFLKETEIMDSRRHDYFQADTIADYICDYLDSTMDQAVVEVFEDFMASQPELAEYVKNANSGMKALMMLRDASTEANGQ